MGDGLSSGNSEFLPGQQVFIVKAAVDQVSELTDSTNMAANPPFVDIPKLSGGSKLGIMGS